jgi:hypothetical protein
MIFRQRISVTDLTLSTWTSAQSWILRVLGSAPILSSAHASEASTSVLEDTQLVAALGAGIFIGLGIAALLTDQLMAAIGYLAPLWFIAMLQVPLHQHAKMRRRGQLPSQQAGQLPVRQPPRQQAQKRSNQQSLLPMLASLSDEAAATQLVEDALRHLHDCSYLGQHPFAQLHIVKHIQWTRSSASCLNSHLSSGQALYALLVDVIEQLRPKSPLPTGAVIPPREWYPYIILHASYVEGERTREIMARLCIGEGTYNRTRRRALQGISKAILEIEQQIRS